MSLKKTESNRPDEPRSRHVIRTASRSPAAGVIDRRTSNRSLFGQHPETPASGARTNLLPPSGGTLPLCPVLSMSHVGSCR